MIFKINRNSVLLVMMGLIILALFFTFNASAEENAPPENPAAPEISPAEKLKQNTEQKRNALAKIFDLTLLEDQDLKTRLNNLKNLTPAEETAKNALLNLFEENVGSYQVMRKRLARANDSGGIKELALDFKEWRKAVYKPKVEKIVTFTLIFQEKNILAMAAERLEKIKSDLEKLESAKLIKKDDTENLLADAETSLQQAQLLNAQARNGFLALAMKELKNYFGTSTQAILLELKESSKDSPDDKTAKSLSPKELAEETLKEIRQLYKIFIDIGRLAKNKIGLK